MLRLRIARPFVAVTVLLLAFGTARLPCETRLTRELHAADFGNVKLDLGLRAKLGQLGFLAALSGFRTLVADLLWVDAEIAWEKVQYGRMNLLFQTVTTLAPHNITFWEMSSWHMAYNASVRVMEDKQQPKVALRRKAQREYFLLGKYYLEQGILNNPRSYELYEHLGALYKAKFEDHYNAFLAYDKAKDLPHAPTYEKRFAAYELCKCPGHEQDAWKRLRALYDMGPQERLPTLETDLRRIEETLQLPPEQRVYKSQPPPEVRVYKLP